MASVDVDRDSPGAAAATSEEKPTMAAMRAVEKCIMRWRRVKECGLRLQRATEGQLIVRVS